MAATTTTNGRTRKPAAKPAKKTPPKEATAADKIKLRPIKLRQIRLGIRSVSPMIQHNWADKALRMMRDKHAGIKAKARDVRDPQAEGEAAAYRTPDGKYGIPAIALKAAIIGAAHRDMGIPKTQIMRALCVLPMERNAIIPIKCDEPVIQEDHVSVGNGSTDLRYRPYFNEWSAVVSLRFDMEWLNEEILVNLIERAGFACGIGDWRREKGGDYGMFTIDESVPIKEERIR